jgi:hypothetical protein
MNLNLKKENQIVPSFESLMDDDSIVIDELSLLACNIRREVINCWIIYFYLKENMKIGKPIIWSF